MNKLSSVEKGKIDKKARGAAPVVKKIGGQAHSRFDTTFHRNLKKKIVESLTYTKDRDAKVQKIRNKLRREDKKLKLKADQESDMDMLTGRPSQKYKTAVMNSVNSDIKITKAHNLSRRLNPLLSDNRREEAKRSNILLRKDQASLRKKYTGVSDFIRRLAKKEKGF